MNLFHKKKIIALASMLAVSLVLAVTVPLFLPEAFAQPSFGFLPAPFGGRVLFTVLCTCGLSTGSTLVTVGPPRGGTFMKTPLTRVFEHKSVFPPNWVLGLAAGTMTCLEGALIFFCVPIGTGKIMLIVGTSRL